MVNRKIQGKYVYGLIKKLQYLRHYTLQMFWSKLLMKFILFLNVYTTKTLSITSKIFIKKINFTLEKKRTWALAFLNTWKILKLLTMEIFLHWYIGNLHILTSTCIAPVTAKQNTRKALFHPCCFCLIYLTILTGKVCVLPRLYSIQYEQWLLGCFWSFSNVYTIN